MIKNSDSAHHQGDAPTAATLLANGRSRQRVRGWRSCSRTTIATRYVTMMKAVMNTDSLSVAATAAEMPISGGSHARGWRRYSTMASEQTVAARTNGVS